MRIEKCWFCSSNIYPGKGTKYVRGDLKEFNFCRSKCIKLFKRRLNPRRIKWTKISRFIRGKEIDGSLINKLERRLDQPEMYERERMQEIVELIPKAIELRGKIEGIETRNRIMQGREERREDQREFIRRYGRLLENEKNDVSIKKVKRKAKKVHEEECL